MDTAYAQGDNWLADWLSYLLAGTLTASAPLINPDPLIQTDVDLDVRPALRSRLVSIASGSTTSLNYLFTLEL